MVKPLQGEINDISGKCIVPALHRHPNNTDGMPKPLPSWIAAVIPTHWDTYILGALVLNYTGLVGGKPGTGSYVQQ